MNAKDLRAGAPRRWSDRIDGIGWLPRLIDKTRAAFAGTLGTYLFGQSPIDRGLLRALDLSHRDFAEIVRHAPDDAAVLAALTARDAAAVERARAWSERLQRDYGVFLWVLDVDDGYRASWLRGPIMFGANAIAGTVKRVWPSRAAEAAAKER